MFLRGKKKSSREVSLFEPIGQDKEGNEIHLVDVIEQNTEVDDGQGGKKTVRSFLIRPLVSEYDAAVGTTVVTVTEANSAYPQPERGGRRRPHRRCSAAPGFPSG